MCGLRTEMGYVNYLLKSISAFDTVWDPLCWGHSSTLLSVLGAHNLLSVTSLVQCVRSNALTNEKTQVRSSCQQENINAHGFRVENFITDCFSGWKEMKNSLAFYFQIYNGVSDIYETCKSTFVWWLLLNYFLWAAIIIGDY